METNDPFNELDEKNEAESNLIGKLEKKLYSRTDEIQHKERTKLNPKKFGSMEEWKDNESLTYKKKAEAPHVSLYTKFFIFSLGFFLIAAGIAGYSFFVKRTVVSSENVSLSLFGPVSLKGGEELALQVLVDNQNEVPLNNIDLSIDFPKGSRDSNDTGKEITRYLKRIPSIAAKEVRTETIKVVFLGEENQKKDINVNLKFRIEGSGSSYTKNKPFSVNLTSSPLTIKADLLKEAVSGQDMVLGVDVKSSSPSLLKNPILEIAYPKGFVFKSASPAPTSEDNFWSLGDMNFGDEKHFEIKGSILGENEQEKVFNISTGVPSAKNSRAIDIKFLSLSQSLSIKKPFLGVNLFLNGSAAPEYVLSGGNSVDVSARWVNNLSGKVTDGQITITLSGEMMDPKKVTPKGDGYYDASKGSVLWDGKTTASLVSIDAGAENTTGLTLALLPFKKPDGTVFKNPVISVGASVKGKRISEANVPEEITSFVESKIKVGTIANISPALLFKTGPFSNSGPLPFRVEKETTVTVDWKAFNSVNDVSGGRVKAVLPRYVRWTGNVSPDGADISYNSISGEVVWNIGKLKAGAGYEGVPKEVAFQVGVTPGISQLNQIPVVVTQGTFTGTDEFTGGSLNQNIVSSSNYESVEPGFSRDWVNVEE